MSCKCFCSRSMIYLKFCGCRSYTLVSYTEHMLSCWFEVSRRRVMLSVCLQGHVRTSSLPQTLSNFFDDMSMRPPSTRQTFAKLRCAVSALTDHVLLPRIVQSLRLPPRQSALCNPRINLTNYHVEQCKSFSTSHLHYPQENLSSSLLVNQIVWLDSDRGLQSSKKLRRSCQHALLHWLKKFHRHDG